MNHLLGTSVVGRMAVGVAGIRCRPSLYSPYARMVKLVKARSLDDCKICGVSVGNWKMDEIVGHKETDFASIFTEEEKAQKEAGLPKEMHFGSVFTGEVEKRYLDYLAKLDWASLSRHIVDFPRRRSEDEVKLIFEKWAAHFGNVFHNDNRREEYFGRIKKKLAIIDAHNSTKSLFRAGLHERSADIRRYTLRPIL